MTKNLSLVVLVALATLNLSAQGPATGSAPAFDVASVKKNTSGEFGASFGGQPGQLSVRNNTLRNIVRNTYQLQNFQIVGGPGWFDTDRFDITARAPEAATPQQMLPMVRALLADRFKLVVHTEMRPMPVYMLVVDRADKRLGPKLTPSSVDCAALMAARPTPPPQPPGGGPFCGTRANPGRVQANAVAMAAFARNLSNFAGRFVIDQTGLAGNWDIDLQWTPDPGLTPALPPNAPPLPASEPNGPSLFSAIQEQLGLKLDSQRAPIEVLVVDSAEQPSPD